MRKKIIAANWKNESDGRGCGHLLDTFLLEVADENGSIS